MLFFLFTTTTCNLKCSYCEDFPQNRMPVKVEYELDQLAQFIENDPDPVFVFYGGEPLVNIPFIQKVMDRFDAGYVLQTNATLLDRLPDKYLMRMESILVSIDGRAQTYDQYRGKGMYAKIVKQCQNARKRGYAKDLVARMTVSSHSDIYNEVNHLMNECEIDFDHVYWQLDAGFDGEMSRRWLDFEGWLESNYKPGLTKLANDWITNMKANKKISGLVPFLGIMQTLRTREKVPLRCGIGHSSFSITTSGQLLGCPVATGDDWNKLGDLQSTPAHELQGRLKIKGPCQECDIRDICGGRCLISTNNNYWGDAGFRQVCQSIRHLVSEMKRVQPEVEELLQNNTISPAEFKYPATRYSLEVIP